MHALMAAIHTSVAYVPGSTTTETTAEQALEAKRGVCQDHAHIFIAAARMLKLPARYVSGYLMMEGLNEQTATMPGPRCISEVWAGSASTPPTTSAPTIAMCAWQRA